MKSVLLFLTLVTGSSVPGVAADLDVNTAIAQLNLREAATPMRDMSGWRVPRKIIVNIAEKPERLAWFQAVVKGPVLIPVNSEAEAVRALAANRDVDALVGFQCDGHFRPNPGATEMIRKAVASKTVRWIQIASAGIEGCAALPEARDSKILFTNLQGVDGTLMAEHTMALLLYLTRRMDQTQNQQHEQIWRKPSGLEELDGKTMLILGLGGNGLQLARRANAFGMKIIATRNTGRDHPDYVEYVGGPDETMKLAGQADVIVSTLPLTPQTTHLFNADFFGKLKPTAYFINVGRGESVVTDDLVAALERKQIAGAGLDVTDPEPLPKGHPFWTTPNLVITPHDGTDSDGAENREQALIREQMRRYVAGEKMLMIVDMKRGY